MLRWSRKPPPRAHHLRSLLMPETGEAYRHCCRWSRRPSPPTMALRCCCFTDRAHQPPLTSLLPPRRRRRRKLLIVAVVALDSINFGHSCNLYARPQLTSHSTSATLARTRRL
nr:hypothetical protein Iba_chr10eCG11030 [Ipomoea batatas]